MGAVGIKLYDKHGIMARVECTTNDVSFFKTHRVVEQRDGNEVWKLAPLHKSIYSLRDLRKVMHAANERYLAFIAAIDNPDAGLKAIDKVAQPVREDGRSYRGFNLFLSDDYHLFLTLARESGVSAASERWISELIFPGSHRLVVLGCSSVFEHMDSSRKWGVATSITSPRWEDVFWSLHSTSENL